MLARACRPESSRRQAGRRVPHRRTPTAEPRHIEYPGGSDLPGIRGGRLAASRCMPRSESTQLGRSDAPLAACCCALMVRGRSEVTLVLWHALGGSGPMSIWSRVGGDMSFFGLLDLLHDLQHGTFTDGSCAARVETSSAGSALVLGFATASSAVRNDHPRIKQKLAVSVCCALASVASAAPRAGTRHRHRR